MGVWGHCPQKILKFNSANLFIFSTISRHFATSHNTLQQSTAHLTKSTAHFVSENTQFWPCLALHQNSNYSATLQRYLTIQKATPVVRIDLDKKQSRLSCAADKFDLIWFIDPRRMKGWVGLVSWPGQFTRKVVTSPAVCRAQDRVSRDRILPTELRRQSS